MREEQAVEKKQHPSEEELYPRRWLIRNGRGELRVETYRVTDCDCRAMGTNESLEHAAIRVGWMA